MSNILSNVSGKIEPSIISALIGISKITDRLNLSFFVVGATARDMIMEHFYGIKSPRMTKDIDIAVCVADWEEYSALTEAMLATDGFTLGNPRQRFNFENVSLDIIPFGAISGPEKRMRWPPGNENVLCTIGFDEAFKHSIVFRLNSNPVLDVKLPTIPGLAIMKLMAWNDQYPERSKDAEDLCFIMREYQNAGIFDRLYDQEAGLLREEEFDNERAGARLLGRDMVKISSHDAVKAIMEILAMETGEQSHYRLARQMNKTEGNIEKAILLLEKLKKGFDEGLRL